MKRFIGVAGAVAMVAACGLAVSEGRAASVRAATPSIQLISPTHLVTVGVDGSIPIQVKVTGIRMNASAMGRKNVPGEGHYHFYVDCIPSAAYSRPNNFGGCWAGATASVKTSFDLATSQVKISPGTHTLFLALAENDHVLYRVPPVSVLFRVVEPTASIQLISPLKPVTVGIDGSIPIQVKVSGITLSPQSMGKKNVPGQGHYHFYVDCIPSAAYSQPNNFGGCWAGATASAKSSFDLATSQVKVKPGTHILLIALAQNDHVLFKAPAVDVVFTVVP